MLAILSPAKTLDFESPAPPLETTTPDFLDQSEKLVRKLRTLSRPKLADLMSVSAALAELNHERYRAWNRGDIVSETARPAIFAFKGDVYTGIDLPTFRKSDFKHAQKSLRILSGLYGILRPLDSILPYRLEMGTNLATGRKKNLYEFWGTTLTESLNASLRESKSRLLVNLASNEYYSALQPESIEAEVITPTFKDLKNGTYKFLSFYGKKARGMMADYLVRNRCKSLDDLKAFSKAGYLFNEGLSKGSNLVFTRDKPE